MSDASQLICSFRVFWLNEFSLFPVCRCPSPVLPALSLVGKQLSHHFVTHIARTAGEQRRSEEIRFLPSQPPDRIPRAMLRVRKIARRM
jgi:hypothetical protein